ncbi:MAG: chitobiase/beta-hexosaminidase C-terminal domain-containing protein [Actinomycetota bacterium]|nr:chitobiase/beta-hexosaminidase C-terminal domain-containing protein [Actinomycetota bacterium]
MVANYRPTGPTGGAIQRHRALTGRLSRVSALAVLSCAVATAGLVLPADAAVNAGHTVFVLKDDSIVEAEGYAPGENLLVEVRRNGVVVGSVEGPASDPGGTFIINHDVCWDDFTPQILPGDVVTVASSGGVERVPVTDIHVTQGPRRIGSTFTIKGRVVGPRIPVDQLQVEARTNDPIRFRPIAPNLNPDSERGEVRGEISYDSPLSGDFTATFSGLNAQQQEAADNLSEFFVSHAPAANEMTMATEGTGAPGPGCPPVVRHAVTGLSMPVINLQNRDRNLRVSGMTLDATAVSVRLRDADGTPVTSEVTPAPATGAQTWAATFTPAQMQQLNGRINVSARYTTAEGTVSGATMSLLKDLVAPRRPSASPDGGVYRRRQSVSLNAQAGTQIRYTLGTRQPAPRLRTGSVYRGRQLRITATQTLKAIAVDKAGNVSSVTKERYVIRR